MNTLNTKIKLDQYFQNDVKIIFPLCPFDYTPVAVSGKVERS